MLLTDGLFWTSRLVGTGQLGSSHGYLWKGDILQGRLGYFLIGSTAAANLWRVTRVEVDYAKRYNFTLFPVKYAHGLPSPDFTIIGDLAIRQEIEQHWSELQDALVRNRYYGLVTAAKKCITSENWPKSASCFPGPGSS
jgi:hypothetical protein